MVNWVASLNVGLSSTLGLTSLMSCIVLANEGLGKGVQGKVLNTLNLQTKHKSMIRL